MRKRMRKKLAKKLALATPQQDAQRVYVHDSVYMANSVQFDGSGGAVDLSTLPTFELPSPERLSGSFETNIDEELFYRAFPTAARIKELWNKFHGKK